MAAGKGYREVLIRAPAKINLGLQVGEKRGDGYHEIRTLFQAVSLSDRLRLRRGGGGIRLHCRSLPGEGRDNLAWRAAEIFFRETGLAGGADIFLEKKIPVGGGLGGGSSDAAAVLLGLSRLFGVRPPAADLVRWGASLGSDVPFFLFSGAALGTGRGERIEPLSGRGPRGAVLIHAPDFGSPTAAVYRACRPRRLTREKDDLTILLRAWRKGNLEAVGRALFNDLEGTVLRGHPSLADAKERLSAAGSLGTLVSGSGSCLFALFPDRRQAGLAMRALRAELPGRRMVAEFLPPRRRWGVVKR